MLTCRIDIPKPPIWRQRSTRWSGCRDARRPCRAKAAKWAGAGHVHVARVGGCTSPSVEQCTYIHTHKLRECGLRRIYSGAYAFNYLYKRAHYTTLPPFPTMSLFHTCLLLTQASTLIISYTFSQTKPCAYDLFSNLRRRSIS